MLRFPVNILLPAQILNNLQAFEELLRANDIDYYMGQSFREQLAQNTALAQRVVTKISGRKEHLPITHFMFYSFTFLWFF